MERLIKEIRGTQKVIFDQGNFDDWCVYVVDKNGNKKAPFDEEYFTDLKSISKKYPGNKLYNDFVKVYDLTTKIIDDKVLTAIDRIVNSYDDQDKETIDKWFTVIYAGMIAEENKNFAVLKKRIKRLGMHQILILDFEPKVAANFSKGKKWRELDTIMKPLGF